MNRRFGPKKIFSICLSALMLVGFFAGIAIAEDSFQTLKVAQIDKVDTLTKAEMSDVTGARILLGDVRVPMQFPILINRMVPVNFVQSKFLPYGREIIKVIIK